MKQKNAILDSTHEFQNIAIEKKVKFEANTGIVSKKCDHVGVSCDRF